MRREGVRARARILLELWNIIAADPPPAPPPLKVFKPKCPELPILKSYHFGAPESFWEKFPTFRNAHAKSPFVMNPELLMEMAIKVGVNDMVMVEAVCNDIRYGCNLMIDADKCKPNRSTNAPSARKEGRKVTDALASWIKKRIAIGPFDSPPDNAIVSGIQVKMKPDGSTRIIINQSSPKGSSINHCLDKKTYPVKMGGIKEFVRALNFWGRGAKFCKVDWESAYKHFWIREKDLRYNWVKWLDKYFCELCLVFGCVSSVGLYDRGAKVILYIALREAEFPIWCCIQHLDDVCSVGGRDGKLVAKFYSTYCRVCKDVGVSLASTDEPDKAFAPTTEGLILGVMFCTETWTWWLREDKLNRILWDIEEMLGKADTNLSSFWSVMGKIMYVKELAPQGRYYISELMKLNFSSDDGSTIVKITGEVKEQLRWWSIFLRLCFQAGDRMPIPSGYDLPPPWAKTGDSDAAGGSHSAIGNGMGVVVGRQWVYFPWPRLFNTSAVAPCCGMKWRQVLL